MKRKSSEDISKETRLPLIKNFEMNCNFFFVHFTVKIACESLIKYPLYNNSLLVVSV